MLAVLLKFLVPILVFYYCQRWLRKLVDPSSQAKKQSRFGDAYPRKQGRGQEADVIEICTECGNVREKFHRCRFKDQ